MTSEKQRMVAIMKENSLHAYLATCDGDQPIVRPVSPIVEDDLSIWITTFATSRKVKQLQSNPKICLAFLEQPHGDRAAVVFGEALVISDPQAKKRVWALAGFDLSQHFPGRTRVQGILLTQNRCENCRMERQLGRRNESPQTDSRIERPMLLWV